MSVVELTDSNFKEEVQSGLTLVDFWAPWCGPCRIMSPVVEELSSDYEGRIKVAKMNIDENTATAMQYRVMSIPNMILFQDGQPVDQLVGARPKRSLETLLNKHLESAEGAGSSENTETDADTSAHA